MCLPWLWLAMGQPEMATALPFSIWLDIGIPILPGDQRNLDNAGPDGLAAGATGA